MGTHLNSRSVHGHLLRFDSHSRCCALLIQPWFRVLLELILLVLLAILVIHIIFIITWFIIIILILLGKIGLIAEVLDHRALGLRHLLIFSADRRAWGGHLLLSILFFLALSFLADILGSALLHELGEPLLHLLLHLLAGIGISLWLCNIGTGLLLSSEDLRVKAQKLLPVLHHDRSRHFLWYLFRSRLVEHRLRHSLTAPLLLVHDHVELVLCFHLLMLLLQRR